MLKPTLVLAALVAFATNAFAEEIILDCSPPPAVGFRPTEEKIYISPDLSLAVYQVSKSTGKYSVALAAGASPALAKSKIVKADGKPYQTVTTVPNTLFIGVAPGAAQVQIYFNPEESAISFSRNVDSDAETYRCSPEARVQIDWDAAEQAILRSIQEGGPSVF